MVSNLRGILVKIKFYLDEEGYGLDGEKFYRVLLRLDMSRYHSAWTGNKQVKTVRELPQPSAILLNITRVEHDREYLKLNSAEN